MTVQDIGQRTVDFVFNASAETATRVRHTELSMPYNALNSGKRERFGAASECFSDDLTC
jgi:hypothetical protein